MANVRNLGLVKPPKRGFGRMALGALVLAPLLVFALFLMINISSLERRSVETLLRQSADQAALSVERDVAAHIAALESLATSYSLDNDDFDVFRREAMRVLGTRPEWAGVILQDLDTQLVNTIIPRGTPMPPPRTPSAVAEIIDGRVPTTGGIVVDPSRLPEPYYTVRVPIIRSGTPRSGLGALVRADTLADSILPADVPGDATASILDRDGRVMANTDGGLGVGQQALPSVLERIRSGTEFFFADHGNGSSRYVATATVPSTGWTVIVGVPSAAVTEPVREKIGLSIAGGLAALALTGVFSLILSLSTHRRVAAERLIAALEAERAVADELRAARDEAERANTAKSRFLAAASHDLRQPLQGLYLLLAALDRHIPGDEGRGLLTQANEALMAQKVLLDSLLDVSKLESGAVTAKVTAFALDDLLAYLDTGHGPVARAKGLSWHVARSGGWVRSDPVLLGRMLSNLVENAIKYTEDGGVCVLCEERDGMWAIEVSDTGVGIPEGSIEDIFIEFHQLHGAERDRAHGLGLGLAIVRRLSELLGHPVRVRSEPGRGSAFVIEVPVAPARPGQATLPSADGQAGGEGRLALVIDDERMVRQALAATLRGWGWEVAEAATIEGALSAIGFLRPSILLADYRLADGRTGVDAIVEIRRACGAEIPGLLLTGELGDISRDDAAPHGIGVIHKPVSPDNLKAALLAAEGQAAAETIDAGAQDEGLLSA